jgi:hypothetical protein
LRDLCEERGAWYGSFQEEPKDHFFDGVELVLGVVGTEPADLYRRRDPESLPETPAHRVDEESR